MEVFLRQVQNEDCDLLFKWSNDKLVRENSFNSNEIKYNDHINWFYNKLNSSNCHMFILYFTNIPIGQARMDVQNKEAIISYSIDINYRGQGFSLKMLKMLEKAAQNCNSEIDKLIGYVKLNNISSQKVFEKLEYNKLDCDKYIKYYKLI